MVRSPACKKDLACEGCHCRKGFHRLWQRHHQTKCRNRWKHVEYNRKRLGVSKELSLSSSLVVIDEKYAIQILNSLFGRSAAASLSSSVSFSKTFFFLPHFTAFFGVIETLWGSGSESSSSSEGEVVVGPVLQRLHLSMCLYVQPQ